ncbi:MULTISPECIES: DUF896 domain-containing protein [Coprobacillaceae]|uniref:DUF896 domain-containing protein n=1 Tax=Coprobacillaceae TaxID=2810280 RepID=UPI000E498FF8|nr:MULTISPECIES: DUF896 domain-containing protein [Coprobacillaceae]RHM63669.1 DUF896 domain-containing protein [Coprobacillus sp. AF33-1AC]RHS96398.1 DUF896 domain-containing protein [Erysipelatoclostridium sp. AM42-17]
MAEIDQKLISRINELAKKKKEGTITEEELDEQKELRAQYLKAFRAGFKQQLSNVKVVDEKGNDVTPHKKTKHLN